MFWEKAKPLIPDIEREVQIGEYRVDFLVGRVDLVIELDGHEYHKTKQQRTRDAQQMRCLLKRGFQTVRFTGTEIWKNADHCALETLTIVKKIEQKHNLSKVKLNFGRIMNEDEINKYEMDEILTDDDAQDWGYQDLEHFWDCNDPD